MGTPLDEVIDLAFSLVHDMDFAKMEEDNLKHLAYSFLDFAISRFKECKADLTIVEDEFGEKYFKDILTTEEKTILAYGWTYYWLNHKAMYSRMLKNQINTKDWNNLSNANLLLRLNEMMEITRKNFFRLRKAYTKNYDNFQGWN